MKTLLSSKLIVYGAVKGNVYALRVTANIANCY